MVPTQCRLASADEALARETAHGPLNHCDRVTKGSTGTGANGWGIPSIGVPSANASGFLGRKLVTDVGRPLPCAPALGSGVGLHSGLGVEDGNIPPVEVEFGPLRELCGDGVPVPNEGNPRAVHHLRQFRWTDPT